LSQQKAQGAAPAHLLFTVQLLHQELVLLQAKGEAPQSRKVALSLPFQSVVAAADVVMPMPIVQEPVANVSIPQPALAPVVEKEVYVLELTDEPEEELPSYVPVTFAPEPSTPVREYVLRKPAVQESLFDQPVQAVQEEPKPAYSTQQFYNTAFETVVEVPTLTQYKPTAELHERLAEQKESLNDRLKQEKIELAHMLKETPIKDLRKGIGINDRFTFVRELFRGDDAAYERSIKTINGFGIFSEAEYWISRELKFKLGWDDRSETVQHFYQLVRRRFS
jgi:hypothetical protein